ncbi:phage major capsid protein [Planctomycetes bacterium TBK1r]|uniref:Phage capsid family protein n=1 Tax=Stieleria magnilauensis TaxID=2527963 RepID=A0ABX5XY91_9BACT|nr:Phage capsid family protein [Planctomycetes bacterium TBK1r]QDV87003.1 Phage capsid family protein [Planctomycetes bacterium TBK1r]
MIRVLNAKEIREEIAEKQAAALAIGELAEAEGRELTDDEQKEFDSIVGKGKKGTEGYAPGEIDDLEEQLERAEKRQEIQAKILAGRIKSGEVRVSDAPAEVDAPKDFAVPAKARLHGKLKAFDDSDEGEKNAYVAGRWFAAHFLGENGDGTRGHRASKKWLEEHGFSNALSSGDNDGGGLFVPVEMSRAIIRLVENYGIIRSAMDVEPMGSDRKVVPVRVSGMTAYPVAETTTGNEGSNTGTKSSPTWKNIELVARKWKTWCKMSDELNEDSFVSMGDKIAEESALAFAYAEDNAGFNGDSTSAYHGITGILSAAKAGSIYTAATGNTAFSSLDLSDFETMVGQLPDYPGINPTWYISKEGYYASMHRLMMAAGGNTTTNFENGGGPRFLGLPVRFTNVLNKTLTAQTSTKLAVLGDLRMGAKFGDRRMMSLSLSDQRYWDEDQIGIKATERFDINVHSTGTATEAGAILVLQTPGS